MLSRRSSLQKSLTIFLFALILLPSVAFAHQPRLTESRLTQVTEPEISKAYYGKLTGQPDVYRIQAAEPFDLYVNALVPAIEGQEKDISVVVVNRDNEGEPLVVLEGAEAEWKRFYEPFGADTYWMGPEYRARAEAGAYEIRVSSKNNDSKYSLAIGEVEAFSAKEGLKAITVIPELKKRFFETSPISFIRSPFGWGLIIAMYLLAAIAGFVYRAVLKAIAKGSPRGAVKNIGKSDRVLRLAISLGLLLWAITTTWSPILLFFSGFALFEAMFSWCGFYAAIGKNTCPNSR